MLSSENTSHHMDERRTKRSLLFGVVLWFTHLNVTYGLGSLSCKWSWLSNEIAGIPGLLFVEAALTLAALVLMAYLIYLPWRDWRTYQSQPTASNPGMLSDTEKNRRPLLAFITMLLNGLFMVFIIGNFVPIIALNPCM